MYKIFLFILLITVVYSWEEFEYVLKSFWRRVRRQKANFYQHSETDALVSDIVVLATIPLSLAYLLFSPGNLAPKILILILAITFIALLLKGIQEYSFRKKFTQNYQGSDRLVAIVFSLMGLVSPSLQFATRVLPKTTNLSKYLFALLIPLLIGLGLVIATQKLGYDAVNEQMNILIVIAILGIVLNLTIELLEELFRINNMKLVSLARILLGILIIFILGRNF